VNAVIGGNDVLGSVLLFRVGELDEIAVRTFERCSSIIGVVLLSRDRMEATKSREQAMLLRSLISPRQEDLPLLRERAEPFGLDLSQPVSWILVEMDNPGASYVARQLRALSLLANVAFDEIDGVLVVLCPSTRAEDVRKALAEFARQHVATGFRGVLSRPSAGAADLPGLYASLRRALPVLLRIGVRGHIVAQNEMALYSTLFETHDQASLANFLDATIGQLLAHDDKRGTELATTLLSYFDCNQNAKAAAQKLDIHVNTVRQRLATIEDLLGHWGNATRALEIHIALRLWSLAG
jgi:sugar diacid utilization regulator